jgi:cytochrome c oxidase subunit II
MMSLLILIVSVLAIITIVRAVRILELVSDLSGEKEEKITESDNKFNAKLLLIFLFVGLGGMVYFTLDAKKYLLPVAASEHGVLTDNYLNWNFALIIVVFFITQILLFWYGYRYRHREGHRAYFYPDNHRLEFIWTAVPSVVLLGLIVYGLKLWNDITGPAPKNSMVVEIYGKQFDFTARYAGADNILGKSNFKLISDTNPLGVDQKDAASKDDKIASEIHMPVNTPIVFKLHSRDVLHSMYMPHLRSQMNAVPGMTTEMAMVPTITTDSMRIITKNPKFDYVLLCNKICGVAHYNMHMKVVVESAEDFKKWYKGQNLVFVPETVPADTSKAMAMQ